MGHSEFRATRFFGSLDALRCLAVLAVVAFHVTGSALGGAFAWGKLGVDLFFVISGFLITTLLLREREKYGRISLRAFFMRRLLRIFPLYFTILLAYVVLVAAFERDPAARTAFFEHLPAFATYTSNWFVEPGRGRRVIFFFAWSLAAEEQFYLGWPALQSLLQAFGSVTYMLCLIAVSLTARLGGFDALLGDGSLAVRVLGSVSPAICMGVILAHLLHQPRSFELLWPLLGRRGASLVGLGLVALAIAGRPVTGTTGVHLAMVLLVGACVAREDHWLAKPFRLRPVVHVGAVSYGVYLMHMLCFNVTKRGLALAGGQALGPNARALVLLPLTTALVLAVASLSFRYYESQFLRLKRRFTRLETTPTSDEPEPECPAQA